MELTEARNVSRWNVALSLKSRTPSIGEDGHEQRQSGETACCGANLFDSECRRFRCWPDIGFDDSSFGAARLLLDTRDHRDQLRFVSPTGMVHSPIHDDAFHPGPPGSLITGRT